MACTCIHYDYKASASIEESFCKNVRIVNLCERKYYMGGGMWCELAEWLTPLILDLEVWDSSLACRIVSLDMELYSTLSVDSTRTGLFEARL